MKKNVKKVIKKVLKGICSDLNIDYKYFKELSKGYKLDSKEIIAFIDTYDCVTSIYVDIEDAKFWYEKKKVMKKLEKDFSNILDINKKVNYDLNPGYT